MVGKNQEKMGDSHGDSHDVRFREGKKPDNMFHKPLERWPETSRNTSYDQLEGLYLHVFWGVNKIPVTYSLSAIYIGVIKTSVFLASLRALGQRFAKIWTEILEVKAFIY